jgi:hypothetical protein
MKCRPLTVVSVTLGHVRMSSRMRSLTIAPGPALMNSLGTSLSVGH